MIPIEIHPQIIPTVLIPLTAVGVAISALATFIAALFGIRLKAEGPKKLFEVLLKPRILISALLFNVFIFGGIKSYNYYKNLPSFEFVIKREQKKNEKVSNYSYPDVLEPKPAVVSKISDPTLDLTIEQTSKIQIEKGSFRGAILAGDTYFVSTDAGYVLEFEYGGSAPFRKFYVGTDVSPAPIIYNEKLYVGEGRHETHHARIYKFDLRSGRYEGAFSTRGHTEASAVVGLHEGQALLFAAAGSDGIYAIDPATMTEVWHQVDGHTDSSVHVSEGLVFSGTGREKNDANSWRSYATAYEFGTGIKVWQRELPASSWMEPTEVDNDVCFVFGEVYFKSNVGGVSCYDKKTGESRMGYMHPHPVVAVPIVIEKDIIISDFVGNVCRISSENGRVRWCKMTSEANKSFANATYDTNLNVLVYPSRKGGLYVLNPRDGAIVAMWVPDGDEWSSTLAPVAISKVGWIVTDIDQSIRIIRATSSVSSKVSKR